MAGEQQRAATRAARQTAGPPQLVTAQAGDRERNYIQQKRQLADAATSKQTVLACKREQIQQQQRTGRPAT